MEEWKIWINWIFYVFTRFVFALQNEHFWRQSIITGNKLNTKIYIVWMHTLHRLLDEKKIERKFLFEQNCFASFAINWTNCFSFIKISMINCVTSHLNSSQEINDLTYHMTNNLYKKQTYFLISFTVKCFFLSKEYWEMIHSKWFGFFFKQSLASDSGWNFIWYRLSKKQK